jgi:hypothetical protein
MTKQVNLATYRLTMNPSSAFQQIKPPPSSTFALDILVEERQGTRRQFIVLQTRWTHDVCVFVCVCVPFVLQSAAFYVEAAKVF